MVIGNTLIMNWCFSFPKTLLHVLNLIDITNYAYKKVKSPVPGYSLHVRFTVFQYLEVLYIRLAALLTAPYRGYSLFN